MTVSMIYFIVKSSPGRNWPNLGINCIWKDWRTQKGREQKEVSDLRFY